MLDGSDIRERMEVYGSCGNRVGTVQRVEGGSIRLEDGGPVAGPDNPYIHLYWVESVGRGVQLELSRQLMREECYPSALGPWRG